MDGILVLELGLSDGSVGNQDGPQGLLAELEPGCLQGLHMRAGEFDPLALLSQNELAMAHQQFRCALGVEVELAPVRVDAGHALLGGAEGDHLGDAAGLAVVVVVRA